MEIQQLTDEQLETIEQNYRRKNLATGGKFSLREVMLEKLRWKPNPFGTREVAAKIIELSRQSADGHCTYRDIWSAFRPDTPWLGNNTQAIVANSLGRVVQYCIINRLPILTTLVVQTGTRSLSEKAVLNIYNDCREMGVEVGGNPQAFVSEQAMLSRQVVVTNLPPDH
ncbi:hypothetical protein ABH975_000248 [Bradyrhizobium ottawaense]|uniref:hypothetical protein n=1 Tax=Bradyrhizobium ottawaense TaxID=931866 RepID=UPI003515AC05